MRAGQLGRLVEEEGFQELGPLTSPASPEPPVLPPVALALPQSSWPSSLPITAAWMAACRQMLTPCTLAIGRSARMAPPVLPPVGSPLPSVMRVPSSPIAATGAEVRGVAFSLSSARIEWSVADLPVLPPVVPPFALFSFERPCRS